MTRWKEEKGRAGLSWLLEYWTCLIHLLRLTWLNYGQDLVVFQHWRLAQKSCCHTVWPIKALNGKGSHCVQNFYFSIRLQSDDNAFQTILLEVIGEVFLRTVLVLPWHQRLQHMELTFITLLEFQVVSKSTNVV